MVPTTTDATPDRNPFSTGRIRPGALPFLFCGDVDAERLVARLRENGWWGQIVGPHGSGKSTLLATLRPVIERRGRRVAIVELHDGQRRLPANYRRLIDAETPSVLVIDGYEQLSRLSRWKVGRYCRRRGIGLLVTTHAPIGLPDLFETEVTLDLAKRVVERLLDGRDSCVTTEQIAGRLAHHEGDLRETLFDLYDFHQQR